MKFTPVSAVQAIMLAKRIASRVDPGFASVDIPTFGHGAPVERANSGLTNGGYAEGGEVDAIDTDDEGKTIPESAKTLEHQLRLLIEGRRKAVMYPKGGNPAPEAPDGAGVTITPDGTFHFNPALVTEEQIHEASRQHRLNEVLGLGPYSKQDIAKRIIQGEHPVAVVARDSDGHEVISAAGTHATAAEQIEAMRHQVPEGGSIGIEHPEQVIRDRQAAHRAAGGEVGGSLSDIRPSTDDPYETMQANMEHGRYVGDETVPTHQLSGGSGADHKDRVARLADAMSGPSGHFSRIIVDQDNNVVEGQHRLEAARLLGLPHVPVTRIKDLSAKMPVDKMAAAIDAAKPTHSDHKHQIIQQLLNLHADEGSAKTIADEYDAPKGFEPQWKAALNVMLEHEAVHRADGGAAKADAMGYTHEAYHGTHADFPAFDPEMVDLGTHIGTTEQANERIRMLNANFHSRMAGADEGANIIPLRAKLGKSFNLPDVGMWNDSSEVLNAIQEHGRRLNKGYAGDLSEEAEEANDLKRQFENLTGEDGWLESSENRELLRHVRGHLQDHGYGSVKYLNQVENAYGSTAGMRPEHKEKVNRLHSQIRKIHSQVDERRPPLPDLGDPNPEEAIDRVLNWKTSDAMTPHEKAQVDDLYGQVAKINDDPDAYHDSHSYIVLDPAHLRSRHARFDPNQADSSDLMAANGGAISGFSRGGSPDMDRVRAALARVVSPFSADPKSVNSALMIARSLKTPMGGETGTGSFYNIKQPMGVSDVSSTVGDIPGVFPKDVQQKSWEALRKEGGTLLNLGGDRSALGRLTHINGKELSWPVDLHAGTSYMREPNKGQVWANNPSHATALQKVIRAAAKNGPVFGALGPMGPRAVDSSHNMFDALMAQVPSAEISKADAKAFDESIMRGEHIKGTDDKSVAKRASAIKYLEAWPGIKNAKAASEFARDLPGSHRSDIVKYMDTALWAKRGFPAVGVTRAAISDPDIKGVSGNMLGHRIVKLDPDATNVYPKSFEHSTYSTDTPGEYWGDVPLVQRQYAMPDVIDQMLSNPTKSGQIIHPYSPDSLGRSTARKLFEEQKQTQPINDRMLESIQQGLERQKDYGLNKGGAVSKAIGVAMRAQKRR